MKILFQITKKQILNTCQAIRKKLQLQCNPLYISYTSSQFNEKIFKHRLQFLRTCHTSLISYTLNITWRIFACSAQFSWNTSTLQNSFSSSYFCIKEKKSRNVSPLSVSTSSVTRPYPRMTDSVIPCNLEAFCRISVNLPCLLMLIMISSGASKPHIFQIMSRYLSSVMKNIRN